MTCYNSMPKSQPVKVREYGQTICVSTPYHDDFRAACKKLGGEYAASQWTFPISVALQVRRLVQRHFGTGDPTAAGTLVTVRIKAKEAITRTKKAVSYHNRVVASARSRDSGAAPGHDVSALSDDGIESGGSVVNWCTFVAEGTEFEVRNLARADAVDTDKFEVISIDGNPVQSGNDATRVHLEARRDQLEQELAAVLDELGS